MPCRLPAVIFPHGREAATFGTTMGACREERMSLDPFRCV